MKPQQIDVSTQAVTLELPTSLFRWLESETQRRGLTIDQLVAGVLDQYANESTPPSDYDFATTAAWPLCGSIDLSRSEYEHIAKQDSEGRVANDYSEHVDEVVYGL